MRYGFITPASLHYVRNHGPAAKIEWKKHRIAVKGMCSKPKTFTMDDIVALPSITIPVTLVCAGNRRKEENMIKKTIGFNWGPSGVSTGYWTGVRLSDLLEHVGAKTPKEGARFVSFRGPKKELPQGADGSYGTSLKMEYAMDPANDVLIAYKHNGRYLTPDHGFPVRMIIPGFIGGRMVKYLEEIVVQQEESNNHYHYMDNRVLPPHVDAEIAKAEGWWYKPEYIINQLNINSVISSPGHDEVLPNEPEQLYTMKGYCYTGEGRRLAHGGVHRDRVHGGCSLPRCVDGGDEQLWGALWLLLFAGGDEERSSYGGMMSLVAGLCIEWPCSLLTCRRGPEDHPHGGLVQPGAVLGAGQHPAD